MIRRTSSIALIPCLVLVLLAGCASAPSEDVKLGGIALTEVLDGLAKRTVRVMQSINGLDAADAAVPELRIINDDFEDLRYHAPKLSEKGQQELAKHANKYYPQLNSMVQMVMDSPPLANRIGGEMEAMLGHLQALMAPPYKPYN